MFKITNFDDNRIENIYKQFEKFGDTVKKYQSNSKDLEQVQAQISQVMPAQKLLQKIDSSGIHLKNIYETNKQFEYISQFTSKNYIQLYNNIHSIIHSLSVNDYQLLLQTANSISPQLSEEITEIHDIEIENIDESTINDIQHITVNNNSNKNNILQFIFLMIQFLLIPITDIPKEEFFELLKEQYEDTFNVDLTGEVSASVRSDTYLRSGRGKNSPVVLNTKLKTAQSIILHKRKNNWVQVSVYLNGETYTGWIEKSKIIK